MQAKKLLNKSAWLFAAALLLALMASFFMWLPVSAEDDPPAAPARLAVHFVDVKQGDCIIIELPDGKNMLIDAGSGTQESSTITNSVLSYIRTTLGDGFTNFDYAILTHTDSDHCNIMDDVLNAFPSYVCYRPNVESNASGFTDPGKSSLTADASKKSTAAYKKAISAMYKTIDGEPNTVHVVDPSDDGQTIRGGAGDDEYSLTFFSPLSKKYSDSNDYSPIMLLQYRGFKFALSGDAEKENEREFVNKVNAAKTDGVTDKYDIFDSTFCVDVFKAGHHGSETSSSQDYLNVMTSEQGAGNVYYIFSCNAEGNNYYHPRQRVLDRVSAMGATNDKILRTDHHGTISITVQNAGSGYAIDCSTQISYEGDNTVGADTLAGGSGGEHGSVDPDEGEDTEEKSFWEKLTKTQKIIIIVVAVVVVIIIFVVFVYVKSKSGGSGSKGRRR